MVRPAPMRCRGRTSRGVAPMGMQDPWANGRGPIEDLVECAKRHSPGSCGMLHLRR